MRVVLKWIVPAVILFGLHLCYAQLQPPFPPEGDSNCGIHPKLIIPDVELRPFLLPGGFYNQRAFCVTIANEVEDQWMVLEASSDLNSWTELVHVLFTKPEFRPPAPTVHNWYYDSQAGTLPRRFYRVRVPGRSVEQARKLWESQKMRSYRFHILYTEWRSGSLPPYGIYSFEGDIIMIDGKKKSMLKIQLECSVRRLIRTTFLRSKGCLTSLIDIHRCRVLRFGSGMILSLGFPIVVRSMRVCLFSIPSQTSWSYLPDPEKIPPGKLWKNRLPHQIQS